MNDVEIRALDLLRAAGFTEIGIAEHGVDTATLADETGPEWMYVHVSTDSIGFVAADPFTCEGLTWSVSGRDGPVPADRRTVVQEAAGCDVGLPADTDVTVGPALFLASRMASSITGHTLFADGGMSAT